MENFIKNFSRGLSALMLCVALLAGCSEEPVPIPVTGVALNIELLELAEGETAVLNATVSPSNASNKDLLWMSSNLSIAKVSEGVVTALKSGNAKITVKTADGGKTCSCDVVVKSNEEDESTQETVKFDIFAVSQTAASAQFTGSLSGVSEVDLSNINLGLMYSADRTELENGNGAMVPATIGDDNSVTASISSLSHNTIYYYCSYISQEDTCIYGDIKEFATNKISLSVTVKESTIVSLEPAAEFIGSVDGLSQQDDSEIEIGIAYSINREDLKTNSSAKKVIDAVASDGSFAMDAEPLAVDVKYYYCSYIKQNEEYQYDDAVKEIQTWHPYSVAADSDLDMSSAVDLSSSASANCYIVSESGLYRFKAVKGNSAESVGAVAHASILWETFGTSAAPALCDLIKGICYDDGYIAFQTVDAFKEGNAVIAAKDKSGRILWSWHIWMTDEPAGQEYFSNVGTMMDRNLGATSAAPGDVCSLGLLYQWGRKDPFLGSSSISSSVLAESSVIWPDPVASDSNVGTIEYAIANPTTFILFNIYNNDWCYTGISETDNPRWMDSSAAKTIYDPCPAGWRVPDGDSDGVWAKPLGINKYTGGYPYDNVNQGINFSDHLGSDPVIWYPASGTRSFSDGSIKEVGQLGYYWAASTIDISANNLFFNYRGYVSPASCFNCANGQPVRCVQE